MIHLVDIGRKTTPAWAQKIDRWYQLDETSFAFCEALHHWNYLQDHPKPQQVLLALEGASNLADFEFAADFALNRAMSPSKFVYTLPNVCASVLFQLLEISAPVFCLNQGRETLAFAQAEARELAKQVPTVWLFSSSHVLENGHRKVALDIFNHA